MRVISRHDQRKKASTGYGADNIRPPEEALSDAIFDGQPTPREIMARHWLPEGAVHQERFLSPYVDSTRYLLGPQVSITRDDMRRSTWAAGVENDRLILTKYSGPEVERNLRARVERRHVTKGDVWRYHITLNKFSGEVSVVWVTRSDRRQQLWLDGSLVDTSATEVDFPFFAFSQVPVGRIQTEAPPFGILGYKCRKTGKLFMRRVVDGKVEPEISLEGGETVGGVSFAIFGEDVLGRIDLFQDGRLAPALVESRDGGRSYSAPRPIDLTGYDGGFTAVPGYPKPIVDKGGSFHAPIGLTSDQEAAALNYIVKEGALVEAIRVAGVNRKSELEVFPSTVGSESNFGNGVTDGHGLIMVLGTTDGRLFSSNSSAGGIYFPESALLNHEMPLVAAFTASECYSSGLKPNMVSMDYLFIEANDLGEAVTPSLHVETWDMPLPLPDASAKSEGSRVELTILRDCDLEAGKVMVHFDDPSITVTRLDITGLRSAVVDTDAADLKGKTIAYDVLTLFHRHHGEAVIA